MVSAKLYSRTDRKNFYVALIDPFTEREYRESTGTADQLGAERVLAKLEAQALSGTYLPPHARIELERRRNASLHVVVGLYLSALLQDRVSKNYVETTAFQLLNFLEYFESCSLAAPHRAPAKLPRCRLRIARYRKTPEQDVDALLAERATDRPVRLVTTDIVEGFKFHRLGVQGIDETTLNNELKVLRRFADWLVERDYLQRSPLCGVRLVVDRGPPAGRSLTLSEVSSLFAAPPSLTKDWLMVTLLHGLRKGEVGTLRPEDVNIESGFLDLRRHFDSQGREIWAPKFGKERRVPVIEAALPLLHRVRNISTDEYGRIFGLSDRRKAFKSLLVSAGIDGHVRVHDLRHSAYTHMKNGALARLDPEMALGDIRLIFGHSDASMDRVYDHRTIERLRAVASLSPIAKELERNP